jgi:hypothetical protein
MHQVLRLSIQKQRHDAQWLHPDMMILCHWMPWESATFTVLTHLLLHKHRHRYGKAAVDWGFDTLVPRMENSGMAQSMVSVVIACDRVPAQVRGGGCPGVRNHTTARTNCGCI